MAETKESLCCDTEEIHEELLKIVDETMPDETELDSLAELFRALSDEQRVFVHRQAAQLVHFLRDREKK